MVDRYSAWAKSVSDQVLPMMEEILSDELIPKYQRAVVAAFPDIAQSAARETAARNGDARSSAAARCSASFGGPTAGRWAAATKPAYSPDDRTLPVVDPELDALPNQEEYVHAAQRERYATRPQVSQRLEQRGHGRLRSGRQDEPVREPVAELHLRLSGKAPERGVSADELCR